MDARVEALDLLLAELLLGASALLDGLFWSAAEISLTLIPPTLMRSAAAVLARTSPSSTTTQIMRPVPATARCAHGRALNS